MSWYFSLTAFSVVSLLHILDILTVTCHRGILLWQSIKNSSVHFVRMFIPFLRFGWFLKLLFHWIGYLYFIIFSPSLFWCPMSSYFIAIITMIFLFSLLFYQPCLPFLMLFFCVIKSIGYYFPVSFILFLENIFAKFLDCFFPIFHLFFWVFLLYCSCWFFFSTCQTFYQFCWFFPLYCWLCSQGSDWISPTIVSILFIIIDQFS